MTALILNLDTVNLTDEQFYRLCQVNQDWQLERTAKGELIVMPSVGGISGNREADFIIDLGIWNRQTGLGKVFSSSTIFRLPNGGDLSPDAAWISLKRWQSLSRQEQEKFPPICPDFVIELRSRTDSLETLQEKMQEYLDSGLQLGWLINPQQQQVEIYRQNQPVQIKALPTDLNGEDILPGFNLSLSCLDKLVQRGFDICHIYGEYYNNGKLNEIYENYGSSVIPYTKSLYVNDHQKNLNALRIQNIAHKFFKSIDNIDEYPDEFKAFREEFDRELNDSDNQPKLRY